MINNIKTKLTGFKNKVAGPLVGALCATAPMLMPITAYATDDVFGKAESIFKSIYDGLFGISTIVAVVCAVIALLFLVFSKNQRAVESAKEWLKRIAIAYLVICALGLIVNTIESWTSDMRYDPTK